MYADPHGILIRAACYMFIGTVLSWNWAREDPNGFRADPSLHLVMSTIWPFALLIESCIYLIRLKNRLKKKWFI